MGKKKAFSVMLPKSPDIPFMKEILHYFGYPKMLGSACFSSRSLTVEWFPPNSSVVASCRYPLAKGFRPNTRVPDLGLLRGYEKFLVIAMTTMILALLLIVRVLLLS